MSLALNDLLHTLSAFLNAQALGVGVFVATRVELLAFVLSLAMVFCNIRVNPWAWPLAMTSSLLYALVFWDSRLYGEAGLQLFFVVMSCWGWWRWLRPDPSGLAEPAQHAPRFQSDTQRWWTALAMVITWPLLAALLMTITDTDVPWWDAFPTAASVIGTWLLGRKFVENWGVWMVVNAVSVGLFAYKGLWLTTVLYAVFLVLSVRGWQAWQVLANAPARVPSRQVA